MNCSGKHAGHAADLRGRRLAAGGVPATRRTRCSGACADAVEELTGEPAAAVGVDGCGAPVLALSLTGLARAFLRLVDGRPGSPERDGRRRDAGAPGAGLRHRRATTPG